MNASRVDGLEVPPVCGACDTSKGLRERLKSQSLGYVKLTTPAAYQLGQGPLKHLSTKYW